MKRFLFSCFVMSLTTTNAFATHAYRSEDCKSKDHELFYKGNYPVGGMYGILKTGEEEISALPLFDVSETPNSTLDADVIFNELDSKVIEETPTTSDCGFDHTEWTSEKTIEISLITDDAAKKLGLKKGEEIKFFCSESTDYPNGTDCE
jgi:hypothetical protein